MHVDIFSYTSGEKKLLGSVSLDAQNQVVVSDVLPKGVQQVVDDAYARANSPQEFLRTLPNQFLGAYIRARVVAK